MMTKEKFLKELDKFLRRIPSPEREDIKHDFEEHFAVGLEEGKTEEDIAVSLGSPHQIAKELLASYHLEKVETTSSVGNILRAVWAVIGLSFFNLVIVLGPFIALAGIVIGGWILGGGFVLSPLLVLINTVIYPDTFLFFDLFFSFLLFGVGLFITIGMFYITRWLSNQLVTYLQYNVRLVKGGMQ